MVRRGLALFKKASLNRSQRQQTSYRTLIGRHYYRGPGDGRQLGDRLVLKQLSR
jgi:hypothetical protein